MKVPSRKYYIMDKKRVRPLAKKQTKAQKASGEDPEIKYVTLIDKKKTITPEYYDWVKYCYDEVAKTLDRPPMSKEICKYAMHYGDKHTTSPREWGKLCMNINLKTINALDLYAINSREANAVIHDAILLYLSMGYCSVEELLEVVPELKEHTPYQVIQIVGYLKHKGRIHEDFELIK